MCVNRIEFYKLANYCEWFSSVVGLIKFLYYVIKFIFFNLLLYFSPAINVHIVKIKADNPSFVSALLLLLIILLNTVDGI